MRFRHPYVGIIQIRFSVEGFTFLSACNTSSPLFILLQIHYKPMPFIMQGSLIKSSYTVEKQFCFLIVASIISKFPQKTTQWNNSRYWYPFFENSRNIFAKCFFHSSRYSQNSCFAYPSINHSQNYRFLKFIISMKTW